MSYLNSLHYLLHQVEIPKQEKMQEKPKPKPQPKPQPSDYFKLYRDTPPKDIGYPHVTDYTVKYKNTIGWLTIRYYKNGRMHRNGKTVMVVVKGPKREYQYYFDFQQKYKPIPISKYMPVQGIQKWYLDTYVKPKFRGIAQSVHAIITDYNIGYGQITGVYFIEFG